jgi:hypothetical protein
MKKFERIMKVVKQALREDDNEFLIDVERDEGNWVVRRHDDGRPGDTILYEDVKVPPEFSVLLEIAFKLGAKDVQDKIKTVLDLS